MAFKLKTSSFTKTVFEQIGKSTGIQPFALVKIAIALSLESSKLQLEDFKTDNDGLELNRQTISGDNDILFCLLMQKKEKKVMADSDIFPKYFKAHIDRGSRLLLNEFKYSKNNFLSAMCDKAKNI